MIAVKYKYSGHYQKRILYGHVAVLGFVFTWWINERWNYTFVDSRKVEVTNDAD
jgi:hypothetical protein